MSKELFITFIICNFINVIIQTVKSIVTIKCEKTMAALINGIAYGFYTYIIILTNADLPILAKAFIVGSCNLVGVYIVKLVEEKSRKEKLWRIEMTVGKEEAQMLHDSLDSFVISHNYVENVGPWVIFNCYCETKEESSLVREVAKKFNAKYFVTETKAL